MLRTKRYLKLGALAAVIAVLGSCVLIVDSNGGSLFTDIQVGTEYTGQSIGANESNYYAFVAGSNLSGVHNIAVSSMTTSHRLVLVRKPDIRDHRGDICPVERECRNRERYRQRTIDARKDLLSGG